VGWFRADGRRLEPLDPLEDSELPQLATSVRQWLRQGVGVRLLAWRVHRRAVFRITTPRGSRICKLYRKDRCLRERWGALANTPERPWRVPRVIDWEPEQRRLTLEDCAGRSLNLRWLAGDGDPSDGDRIAEILAWLLATPPPAGLPQYGVAQEVRLLEKRLESFQRALHTPPKRAEEVAARVLDALSEEPDGANVLCHRDFHDKQILLNGSGGGALIDLDLVAAGPPALDAGNILAHLRLRALKGARLPWGDMARRITRSAVPAPGIRESLPRWTASALLRLTLIYARRRRPPGLLDALLDSTEQALGRRGEWAGIL
jgi:hypothetical protein